MAAVLEWTTTAPTVPGEYEWRIVGLTPIPVRVVAVIGGTVIGCDKVDGPFAPLGVFVGGYGCGEWRGPL